MHVIPLFNDQSCAANTYTFYEIFVPTELLELFIYN